MKFYDKHGRIHDKWIHALLVNLTTPSDEKDNDFEDDDILEEGSDTLPNEFAYGYRCACGSTYSDDPTIKCNICGTKADVPVEEVALYTDP